MLESFLNNPLLYNFLKAFHIISIVAWFAGLLYTGRLYVYYEEATRKDAPARGILTHQLKIMIRRLWFGITLPAMIATLGFGTWIMIRFDFYKAGWLHIKLLLVLGLIVYVMYMGRIRRRLFEGKNTLSSFKLRLLNEVPTLFLIGIVFIAYLKDFFNSIWGAVVIGLILILLIVMIVMIRRMMNKEASHSNKDAEEQTKIELISEKGDS
jgi:putative membrane protein